MSSSHSSTLSSGYECVRSVHAISESEEEDFIPDTDSENESFECQAQVNKAVKRKIKTINQSLSKARTEKDLFGSDSDNEIVKKTKVSSVRDKKKSPDREKEKSVYDISTDEMSSEDEHNNKPMCPYGMKCYRKNPSHFAEFNHPKSNSSSVSKTDTENREKDMRQSTSQPSCLGVYFTKVTGISEQYNGFATLGIQDILSPRMGKLQRSAQFNYCIDVDWIVGQYPKEFKSCPLLIVHGSQRGEKASLDLQASKYEHVRMCQARMDIPYGTHHTKMMLLLYDNGMRVVIHTANLVERDWFQKTQGGWISPLYPPVTGDQSGDSLTHFREDLIEYLSSYNARQLNEWLEIIKQYDMSETNVFLIGSIPGRHTGSKKSAFGHLKLRKILQRYGPSSVSREDLVIGQFSSVGSMGVNKEAWLCGEWLNSLGAGKGSLGTNQAKLKLIFPTRDNIRLSLEGYPAGQSVPYSASVAKKQIFLHKFFHEWRSERLGRSRASPHIKSFMRTSGDSQEVYWMLLTSSNLSKAAWGAYEKQQAQLMIRSYELGVLFLPQFIHKEKSSFKLADGLMRNKDDGELRILVPFDLPPVPYGATDQPWIWDIPYVKQPDSHGNMWCPR